jgi:hypothetical protein
MTEATTLAYLAGLIDGEGYIGIKKTTVRKDCAAPSYHARLQIRMVDEPAIAFLAETFGGRYYKDRPEAGKRRALYCYQSSDAAAERILRALLPYLRVKRANAEAVLRFREWRANGRAHRTKLIGHRQFQGFRGGIRTVRTMGFSDEYLAACDAAYRDCKRLNGHP